jgi:hypothetical protein
MSADEDDEDDESGDGDSYDSDGGRKRGAPSAKKPRKGGVMVERENDALRSELNELRQQVQLLTESATKIAQLHLMPYMQASLPGMGAVPAYSMPPYTAAPEPKKKAASSSKPKPRGRPQNPGKEQHTPAPKSAAAPAKPSHMVGTSVPLSVEEKEELGRLVMDLQPHQIDEVLRIVSERVNVGPSSGM